MLIFVSGHVDLAKKKLVLLSFMAQEPKQIFKMHEAKDGEIFQIGDIKNQSFTYARSYFRKLQLSY